MAWKLILLWIMGISSGLMVSAGVFTVLFVVGLVPRFAGRTDTAWCEIFYEECLIFGAVLADVLSVFPIKGSLGSSPNLLLTGLLVLIGVFAGIFVGCLSIALSEVLDGIPIFARRIRLKMGVSIAVLMVAVGKIAGSIVYFVNGFLKGYREENMDGIRTEKGSISRVCEANFTKDQSAVTDGESVYHGRSDLLCGAVYRQYGYKSVWD